MYSMSDLPGEVWLARELDAAPLEGFLFWVIRFV
jgi:hypothetical protein